MRVPLAFLLLVAWIAPGARAEEPDPSAAIDLAERYDIRFLGADAEDELGVQARFGDIDGDGLDDVILGAWLADGNRNNRARTGEVRIYFGREMAAPGEDLWDAPIVYGAEANERIGSSADVGDFNGDGKSDLLVGARYAEGFPDSLRPRSGEAYLLLGGSVGGRKETIDLRAKADVVIFGRSEGDRLGRRILAADLDRDGKDDLVLAAVGASGVNEEIREAGAVYIVYGDRRNEWEPLIDLSIADAPVLHGSDDSDALGSAIAAGDWNGDGDLDLFLGCGFADGPSNSRTNAGETFVIFGRGVRFDGERSVAEGTDFTIYGADAYDAAGVAVASGDFDGDGIDDLAVGANLADGPGNERDNCGETYVLFGNRSLLSGDHVDLLADGDLTIVGAERGDQAGAILQFLDWDGDGRGDLVLSSLLNDGPGNRRTDAGMVYAFLGRPQAEFRPSIDLADPAAADLRMLGPTTGDKIATLLEGARLGGRRLLLAGTMQGDGPGDARRDAGEIYILPWKPGDAR
jgi:hypothetical protein